MHLHSLCVGRRLKSVHDVLRPQTIGGPFAFVRAYAPRQGSRKLEVCFSRFCGPCKFQVQIFIFLFLVFYFI